MTETKCSKTGIPSVDRPWMQYYPPELIENLTIPDNTVREYLEERCPGDDVVAMHYYGNDITWKQLFEQVDLTARALKAIGIGEGDPIPTFFRAVPEFIFLLLAAEKIGASILCRDNTLKENVEAVQRCGAKIFFTHDFMSQSELNAFRHGSAARIAIRLSPYRSANYSVIPDHVQDYIDSLYPDKPAYGSRTMTWDEFLDIGRKYEGEVEAEKNIDRPLFCAYTSGSTGPSKQVIHSAHTMIGNLHQMNFYGSTDSVRPTWLLTQLPPSLVAVVVAMILLPLASNKLLILDPFCAPEDVDLEMMRYRPNCWPIIPMFIETVMRQGRVPEDYDMSHLLFTGPGCEAYNNNQIKRAKQFLVDHNSKAHFTIGYGCSEAGSNMTLPMSPYPQGDGNVGIPLPLSTISVFKPGTRQELSYNEMGEICITGPGNMVGYDTSKATARALQTHDDGRVWLHTGDIGYMNEDGVIYALTRGSAPRYGFPGNQLATLPMENRLADAEIEGIKDEFFVIIPDTEHNHHFLPYLYVVLKDGYTIDDIRDAVNDCLDDYMKPMDIFELPERPFFHFKTNRIGLTQELMNSDL